MSLKLWCLRLLLVLCIAVIVTPEHMLEARQLRQMYTIHIQVTCLDTAMAVIHQLPGHNLDSSANLSSRQRTAEFRRRVSSDTFRYVQETLRKMGIVTFETEHASHLAAQITELDVRIAALAQELERLSDMFRDSNNLATLTAISDRLSQVSHNRDSLIGQRNVLLANSDGPIINISLIENTSEITQLESSSFGRRIVDRFTDSLQSTRVAIENFVVTVVRYAIPVTIWAVILFVVWRLFGGKLWRWYLNNAKRKKMYTTLPDTIETINETEAREE